MIPILLLTLADAGAALVGIRYGTVSYSTEDGSKTIEGSLSFLLVAFFCAHVPILLATDVGRPETILIALLLALLTTMSEAIAWRGLDNLFLPLLAFYLLEKYFDMSLEGLRIRALVMTGLIAFVLVYRRFTTIAGSGILGAALFGYVAWALGGWPWMIAPLAFFVAYGLISPPTPTTSQQVHNAYAVLSVVAAGLVWLFLAEGLDWECLLRSVTVGFAANLSLTGVARFRCDQRPVRRSLVIAALAGLDHHRAAVRRLRSIYPVSTGNGCGGPGRLGRRGRSLRSDPAARRGTSRVSGRQGALVPPGDLRRDRVARRTFGMLDRIRAVNRAADERRGLSPPGRKKRNVATKTAGTSPAARHETCEDADEDCDDPLDLGRRGAILRLARTVAADARARDTPWPRPLGPGP